MRLSLHFLSWRAVAAVEQGVAEGLGWVSAKAGVFLWDLTRGARVKCGITGFFEIDLSNVGTADASNEASTGALTLS